MKKINYLNLAFLVFAIAILSSCGGINKMKDTASSVKFTVSPEVLETHAGEVEVTIKGRFPEKYFNKKATLSVTPVLTYANGETPFDEKVLQGEAVEANNQVIAYASGGEFDISGKIPYSDDMFDSDLQIRMVAMVKDKSVEIPAIKIADGVIATSTLVQDDPKAILVGDKFERIQPDSYLADIHYVINRSEVRMSELREDDIKGLQAYVKDAGMNDKIDLKGIAISAYASPDGAFELNDDLSKDRQGTAEKYIKKELKKSKIEDIEGEEFFSLMATPEDWDGFKELMEKSEIKDKELVLRVLSMYSDPEVREKEIKNIAEAFEEIKEEILPKLRRSKLTVNVEKIGYSDEEITQLAETAPDTLNIEEILYAATLTDDLDKKLAIYQKAAEIYPEEFRPKNNEGYILVQLGRTSEAKAAFESAKAIEENDVVKNNLGAIAILEGDITKAEELLTSAMGAGEVVNYNLGIINIKKGNYEAAINYFGNAKGFNPALAKELNGSYDDALVALEGVEEDALIYYLKAIIGAKTQNTDLCLNNLRSAVGMDAALKERAKKDLEFRNFLNDDAFKAIVE